MKEVYVLVYKEFEKKQYYIGFMIEGKDAVSAKKRDAAIFQDKQMARIARKNLRSDFHIEKRKIKISI